ncbi:MAG TPA: ROK family protein [Anaerolineaceae bacterium]|jgi:glucokinase-like ROK family protein
MKKATRFQTKEHNRNLALKILFEHDTEPVSRAEIARITRLTRTTVSEIVADLLDEGLVSEIGMGESLGGKSPILLGLVEDSRWLIGLDLAHTQFCGAVVNLRGKIRDLVSLPVDGRNGEDALALVYEILDRLIANSGQPLVGIGVGTPGLVNASDGVVIRAVNLDWKNLPLGRLLEERYHLPVAVLNDSQAAAIGEHTYGQGHRGEDNLVVVNARHGIGAGIIINGMPFHGDGGSAGEIGHVVVVPQGGLPCRCGKHGCLETVASAQALVKRLRALLPEHPESLLAQTPEPLTLDEIERAFLQADALARQVVLETGHAMGIAVSNLVGILNIHKIVLVGDMARFGEPWVEEIRRCVREYALDEPARKTRVEIGQLGSSGIVLGASAALANNFSLLYTHSSTAVTAAAFEE